LYDKLKSANWWWVIVGLLSIPWLLYSSAAFYMRYVADDICTLHQFQRIGILNAIIYRYNGYLSKYAYSFFELAATAGGTGFIAPSTLILFAIWLVCLSLMLYIVLQRLGYTAFLPQSIAGALLITIALFGALPSLDGTIYWQSALLGHTMAAILFTVWVLVVIIDPMPLAFSGLIAFTMASCSETSAAFIVPMLMLLFILPVGRKRNKLLIGSVFYFIGILIFVVAPGNAHRAAGLYSQGTLYAVISTARTLLPFVRQLVITQPLVMLALLVAPAIVAYTSENRFSAEFAARMLLAAFFAALIIISMCFFISYYLAGEPLFDRAWVVPDYFTLLLVVIGSFCVGVLIKEKTIESPASSVQRRWLLYGAAALLMIASLASSGDALHQVAHMRTFAAEWDVREAAHIEYPLPDMIAGENEIDAICRAA